VTGERVKRLEACGGDNGGSPRILVLYRDVCTP
jgi:hypothetical protein